MGNRIPVLTVAVADDDAAAGRHLADLVHAVDRNE